MILYLIRVPLVALCFALLSAPMAHGQLELEDGKAASVAFDIRFDRLVAQAQAMGMDCDQMLKQADGPEFLGKLKATDLVRIYGALSMPPSLDAAMAPSDGPPMDFFVRIKLASPEAMQLIVDEISETGGTTEINGKQYFVENEDNPEAMMAHLVAPDEIEFGTGGYVLLDHRQVMSQPLKEVWANVPDDAIRLAVELQTGAQFIAQATQMGKDQLPPNAEPFVGLVDKVASMTFSIDLKNPNMVSLVVQGKDEAAANELKGALDSLLGMAKLMGGSQLGPMKEQAPAAAATANAILNSLAANQEGLRVSVKIPQPEGLAEAIDEVNQLNARMASEFSQVNDFKQAALAVHNHFDAYKKFPFAEMRNVHPELGWRVRVLPFIEQNPLYEQMDMSKGPAEAPNAQFTEQMPAIYGAGGTKSQIVWVESKVQGFANIIDGTSNTIMFLQVPAGQPWMESGGISQADAAKVISEIPEGESLIAAFYDGSVQKIPSGLDADTVRRLLDPTDGEIVDRDFNP